MFNVGNDQEICILALAEKVRDLTGRRSDIQLIPYDQAYEAGFEDMPRRVPNLDKRFLSSFDQYLTIGPARE